jgi:hypothetical protein
MPENRAIPHVPPESVQPIERDDEAAGVVSEPRSQTELVSHLEAIG